MDSITIGMIVFIVVSFVGGFVLGWAARGAMKYRPTKLERINSRNKPATTYHAVDAWEKLDAEIQRRKTR
jgi:hypothetical protein